MLAARPARPRDKPQVEGLVLLVQRWILARLRNRCFFSPLDLNRAIAELLLDLNNRLFKKLSGCRRSAFESIDAPALKPLPATRFTISRWKAAKVNIDYHVEFVPWYERIAAFGHGTPTPMTAEEAFEAARAATPAVATHLDPNGDPGGLKADCPVSVTPDDRQRARARQGNAGGGQRQRDHRSPRGQDPQAGPLHLYFPRLGFGVVAA